MLEDFKNQQTFEAHAGLGLGGRILAAVVVFPVVAMIALLPLRPPAVDVDAPPTEFSATRAMKHLETIAAAPHPIGSAEHARVRDYLVGQIEALGLEALIQTETMVTHGNDGYRVAKVKNVLTRLTGTEAGAALLLVAHYDSIYHSPGASDDGAGVAALLETARALRAGPQLKNDVIFLFSDGEERRLVGAEAFQKHHPWASDVALVLNFEARGARGPSIMFETGPGTGPWMEEFASHAPHALASSYSHDAYRRLPNNTDFSVFMRAGKPGFNFAFIEDLNAYHSRLDTVERMDPRSLQHHGSNALSLARGFGDVDLGNPKPATDKIYFNVPLLGLVVYSTWLAIPWAALLVVAASVLLYLGIRSETLRPGRVLLSLIAVPAVVATTVLAVMLLHRGLFAYLIAGRGLLADPSLYRLGLVLVALAVAAALLLIAGSKLGAGNLSAGAAVFGSIFALVTTFYLPSSSYLLCWPLVFSLLSLFILCKRIPDGATPATRIGILLLLLAVPAVVLWVPAVSLVGTAFGFRAGTVLAGATGLVISLLYPQVALMAGSRRRWILPLAILTLGLGLSLMQALGTGYDDRRPRENSIFYALDPESQKAVWATLDEQVDAWTSQFLGPEGSPRVISGFFTFAPEFLAADAPLLPLPAPSVTDAAAHDAVAHDAVAHDAGAHDADPTTEGGDSAVVETAGSTAEAAAGTGRRLQLRVESSRQASTLFLELRSESPISSLSVDGQEVISTQGPNPQGVWWALFYGVSPDGFDVEVGLEGQDPLNVLAVDRVYSLPEIPGFVYEPRPKSMRPYANRLSDASLVRRSFIF